MLIKLIISSVILNAGSVLMLGRGLGMHGLVKGNANFITTQNW